MQRANFLPRTWRLPHTAPWDRALIWASRIWLCRRGKEAGTTAARWKSPWAFPNGKRSWFFNRKSYVHSKQTGRRTFIDHACLVPHERLDEITRASSQDLPPPRCMENVLAGLPTCANGELLQEHGHEHVALLGFYSDAASYTRTDSFDDSDVELLRAL